MKKEFLQLIYAFLGSLGFALLFNLKVKRLIPAALGGLLSWGVFLILKRISNNLFLAAFIASSFAALYSEILARLLKAPTTVFIIPALICLIPFLHNAKRRIKHLESGFTLCFGDRHLYRRHNIRFKRGFSTVQNYI